MEYCGEAPDMGAYEYITEDCVECGEDFGDLNGDNIWNILDIVTLSTCVLYDNCSGLEYSCTTDINQDGTVNILDIVILAQCVLALNCNEI